MKRLKEWRNSWRIMDGGAVGFSTNRYPLMSAQRWVNSRYYAEAKELLKISQGSG
ncbi:MAG: hypothetical protein Ct9H300mP3_00830 [Gammaproteobacteria bacterium]|nr:MAG: hypothetical protein Ct9H300mP3_00830 [Gammaproteobacteria bacterium]